MSVNIGPDWKQLQYAAGGGSTLGAFHPFGGDQQGVPREDTSIFFENKINGTQGIDGLSFGSDVKKAVKGAVDGLSGMFSGLGERLAQFDKGQLNHPEQRTPEQGQKLWELC